MDEISMITEKTERINHDFIEAIKSRDALGLQSAFEQYKDIFNYMSIIFELEKRKSLLTKDTIAGDDT